MNESISDSRNTHLPQNDSASTTAAASLLDQRIDAAIEQKPIQTIPANFAAKVAARAAALPQRRRAASLPIGRSIAWASIVLLALTLFLVAPHAAPSITSLSFDVEILILLELAGLSWGIARFAR